MSLRFEGIGRIGIIALTVLVSCSESDTNPGGGNAGTGGGAAGTATTAGTSSGGSGGGGAATAGSSSGGSTAGSATAGSGGSGGQATGGSSGSGGGGGSGSGGAKSKTTFFVTSDTAENGDLGGLDGADMRCQELAKAAGIGDHTFKAYLSTATVNAKDRIGAGPWVNALGVTVAADLTALHARKGSADVFVDEKAMKINGQWDGSPSPNQHDILTGTNADGTVATGKTCGDWTSTEGVARIGHSDGLGPNGQTSDGRDSWNSAHDNSSCANLLPGGGAGRIYCFAID